MRLILQMIEQEEKVRTKPKKTKNKISNVAELRRSREKLLDKKHSLTLQAKHRYKRPKSTRKGVFDNMERIANEIEYLNKEIVKLQENMVIYD